MWDIPCIEAVIGTENAKGVDTDFTVPSNDARFYTKGVNVYTTKLALPNGAVTVRNSKMVASPELLFLELARKLSIHRLILLGLQLCSHPQGLPCDAITTKQKIAAFLAKTVGHRGHPKAIRALRFVENGSASIMESLSYMILVLPHALGGYGLSGAVFNHKIKLKGEARIRLGQDHCFVDLYYKYAKLGVEYDSYAYHSSPSELAKDAVRSAVLNRMGVKMLHLSTIQLYDRGACRDFAYILAARLGKRICIRAKKFNEMHTLLRELLPNKNSNADKLSDVDNLSNADKLSDADNLSDADDRSNVDNLSDADDLSDVDNLNEMV